MDYIKELSKEFNWGNKCIENIVNLLDEGNTIPFTSRYRKEATGSMDETILRDVEARLKYMRSLDKRKEEVIRNIEEQGKLTPELTEKITAAKVLQEVEDLYLPYRQKRRTRATIAKEKGLESLAEALLAGEDVNATEEDLQGASDIICEYIQDSAEIRGLLRDFYHKQGVLKAKDTKEESSVYDMYYDYQEPVSKILPHRIMAVNRGEKEEFLQVKIEVDEDKTKGLIHRSFFKGKNIKGKEELFESIVTDAFKRLLHPSLEREVRNTLTEKAEEQGIKVFTENLDSLLMQSPVKKNAILGIDPSFRTGCKLAVINELGQLMEIGVIYPHQPQMKVAEAKKKLLEIMSKWSIDLIVIGNGTASRETETLVANLINENNLDLSFVIVSEAGASVYSASKLAKEEFPKF